MTKAKAKTRKPASKRVSPASKRVRATAKRVSPAVKRVTSMLTSMTYTQAWEAGLLGEKMTLLKMSKPEAKPKLRVWWIPQVPGKPFHVEVDSVREARKILNVLADYDRFQFENRVKPDYANVGGLEVEQGDDEPFGWEEWRDDDDNDIWGRS